MSENVYKALAAFIKEAGSQKAAAKKLGISNPFMSDLVLGNRAMTDRVAEQLGFVKVVKFVRKP
jgi:plasmid maintenance system antidote protein VapI